MEILAENRFVITKDLFYEGMLRVLSESYGKLAKKAILFLGIVWLILAAVTIWQQHSLSFAVMELVVLCLASLWIWVYMPRNKAKKAYKAMRDQSGDEMERITRFYEDHFEVEAAQRKKVVSYTEVARILKAKHLMVLLTEEKVGIMVALDGFTVGNEAVVRGLIKKAIENALEEMENG